MSRTTVIAVLIAACLAAGVCIPQPATAQSAIKRTVLQQQDLQGTPDREVTMFTAVIPAGGESGRHSHSGPELLYVLEGALSMVPDGGGPAVTVKTGESYSCPARQVHNAKNASTVMPVKLLSCVAGEKGQPLAVPAK